MPSARSADGPAELRHEITAIAAEPGTLTERAEALLACMGRVVPFDAGVITLLPAGQATHVSLARTGYDERICGYLDGRSLLEDVELVGLRRQRRPVRLCDLPVPPSEILGWAEYLEPAGFRDGVAAGLFTGDGHYLGVLTLETRAADQVSGAARDLLGQLATSIASGLDPLRSLTTIAQLVQRATAGIVLTPSGTVLPLPGLPGHRLLAAGSGALASATAQLAQDGSYVSFLAPLEPGGTDTHARITVLAVPVDVRPFAAAVVLVSPAGNRHGLTPRELQVLGLLIDGFSNAQIARDLVLSQRTVAAHLEHILPKLSAPSRTLAAVRAKRQGLYVPRPPADGARHP